MDVGVRDTLRTFASNTGHRERELEDANGITSLIKKYIVVHMGALGRGKVPVGVEQLYPYVSDDYEQVAMRTHNPPLYMYATSANPLDKQTFIFIMKNGATPTASVEADPKHQKKEPLFQHFRDDVFPLRNKAESWEYSTRSNRWKERAYFFAKASSFHKNSFRGLVTAIHNDGVDPSKQQCSEHSNELERIYSRLKTYELVPESDNAEVVAQEIGSMVAEFSFEPEILQDLFGLESEAHKSGLTTLNEEMDTCVVEQTSVAVRDVEIKAPVGQEWDDKYFRTLPIVMQYKSNAGLNNVFSSKKAVKQMLAGALFNNAEKDSLQVPITMLGRKQKTLPEVATKTNYTPTEWGSLMHSVDQLVDPATHYIFTKQSMDLVELLEPDQNNLTTSNVIKAILTVHGAKDEPQVIARWNAVWPNMPMEKSLLRNYKRYIKKHPQASTQMIQMILDM